MSLSHRRLPMGAIPSRKEQQHGDDGTDETEYFGDVDLDEFVKTIPQHQSSRSSSSSSSLSSRSSTTWRGQRSPPSSPRVMKRGAGGHLSLHEMMMTWSNKVGCGVLLLVAVTCFVLLTDKHTIRSLDVVDSKSLNSNSFLRASTTPVGFTADETPKDEDEVVNILNQMDQQTPTTHPQQHAIAATTKRPHLLLHVGPQKTGSSTLQSAWDIMSKTLEEDNYHVEHITPEHGDFECDVGPWGGFKDCKVGRVLKDTVATAYANGQNLILSDENLDQRFVGTLRELIDESMWQVKVVVVYRRIHEWLVSWYNQINKTTNIDSDGKVLIDEKGNPFREEHKNWPDHGGVHVKKFTDWYKEYVQYWQPSELIGKHRSVEFYNLYESAFPNEVIIYNMDRASGDNFVTDFMCNVVQDAEKSCAALKSNEVELSTINPSVKLSHDILAVAAYEQGLVDKSLSRQEVVAAVTKYVEDNNVSFPIECSSEVVDQIRDWFFGSEAVMFPDDWTDLKREELLGVFDSFVAKGKLCDLDVQKTLDDDNWKTFFLSLGNRHRTVQEEIVTSVEDRAGWQNENNTVKLNA